MGQPVRVLHVCEAFNPGGVVWWLIDVLKLTPREQFHFDFYSLGKTPGMRVQEVLDQGSGVTLFQAAWQEVFFGTHLRDVLRSGNYDIVHAHIFNLSGWMLRHARSEGVPVRIVHYHGVTDGRAGSLLTKIRRQISRDMASRYATAKLGCSQSALDNGPKLRHGQLSQVVYYGVDTERFINPTRGEDLRSKLSLPADARLIAHVGRFYPQKNHAGLIDIFARVADRVPNAHLVLLGDGPLMSQIRDRVANLGIADRVWFLGARPDIAELLPQMDIFIFPSLHEGMGIVLIEARLAGLPVVASNLAAINEAMFGCNGFNLIDVHDHDQFANSIVSFLDAGKRILPPEDWVNKFTRQKSVDQLLAVYKTLLQSYPY